MKKYLIPVALNLLMAAAASAETPPMQLSLKEAVRLALEQNLDLKAELYNPAQAESDIRKYRAMYEPHLTLESSYQDAKQYSANLSRNYDTSTVALTPGAYQLLPTGGTLGLKYQNLRQYNSTATPLGTYWTSSLGLTFNQPLLKNFGRETTELTIRVSEVSKETSLSHLKTRILALVAQVKTEYFKLVSSREDLESRKASLELAQKILAETEARVKAGVLPAMEILNARFGVSSRQKELIDAEKAVSDQIDILTQLIHLEKVSDIVTTDRPDRAQLVINENDAINRALALRPELDELKGQLKSAEIQAAVARNQTMPSLNLVSSAAITGLDKDYNRNVERMGTFDYPAWSIGLQFDYPIGNQSAENDYIKSRLKADQSKVQIDSLKSSIENEVRLAVRGVTSSYKQLDVADSARLYADERVKAYMKKIDVGLATTKDLLDVENDMATARANQIKAEVLYATSVNQLWKTTGELLDREGIKIDSSKSDAVYRGVK